jgi:hypothetical protein
MDVFAELLYIARRHSPSHSMVLQAGEFCSVDLRPHRETCTTASIPWLKNNGYDHMGWSGGGKYGRWSFRAKRAIFDISWTAPPVATVVWVSTQNLVCLIVFARFWFCHGAVDGMRWAWHPSP